TSLAARYSTLYTTCASLLVYSPLSSTTYFTMSGTSMSAPVVAGTVALMLQANPSLTPNTVKAILAYTAERMPTPNMLEQGNGSLNAEGAVRLAAAISASSDTLANGTQWIANPGSIVTSTTIGGQGVIWGDGVIWG